MYQIIYCCQTHAGNVGFAIVSNELAAAFQIERHIEDYGPHDACDFSFRPWTVPNP